MSWRLEEWETALGLKTSNNSCGLCSGCNLSRKTTQQLDPRFCDRREQHGFQQDGAFAGYLVADPETMVHLPVSLSS